MTDEQPKFSSYMAEIGSKGGKAGKGAKKKRSRAHYKRMAAARWPKGAKRKVGG